MEQWFKQGEVNIFKSASNMIVKFSPVDNLPEINQKYKSRGGRDLIFKKIEILINKYFKFPVLTLFKFTLQNLHFGVQIEVIWSVFQEVPRNCGGMSIDIVKDIFHNPLLANVSFYTPRGTFDFLVFSGGINGSIGQK